MNIGHYVLLLEGEAPQADGTQEQSQNQDQNKEQQETKKSQVYPINLDSEDVVKMRQEKENVLKQLQDTIEKKTNNAIQCQQVVANIQNAGNSDQTQLNAAQKTLIQAFKEVSDAKFELAKKSNEYDKESVVTISLINLKSKLSVLNVF